MGGERVPKRVTRGPLGNAGPAHRVPYRPLDGGLVQVMAPLLPGHGISAAAQRRKHPLPRPIVRRPDDLVLKRPGQGDPATPPFDLARVARPPPGEMIRQRPLDDQRQRHDAVHPALATPHPDLAPMKVHVRSEEHTSELQSLAYLVCRLLLE